MDIITFVRYAIYEKILKIKMSTTFEYVQYAMWSLSTPEIAPASDNYYVLCDDWTLHTPL